MVLHTDVEPPVTTEAAPESEEEVQGRSLSQIAWGRLRRDRVAMVSLGVLIVALSLAALSGVINRLMGHSIQAFNQDLISNDGGLPIGHLGGVSLFHLFGVEPGTGRDLFARLLVGSRYSFIIAFSATAITLLLGITVGAIAGYSKGWLDGVLGRLMDLILSFPLLLILLALSPVLVQRLQSTFGLHGNSAEVVYLILVLSLFGWPYLARVVRGQVLSLREREFVESAVSLGSSTRRVLFREILPNLWAPVIVYATLLLPSFIAAEATLAYLGVGLVEPTPSWGAMLESSVSYFNVDPFFLFVPGTYLFIVVLAFNLLGDSVRDALDPGGEELAKQSIHGMHFSRATLSRGCHRTSSGYRRRTMVNVRIALRGAALASVAAVTLAACGGGSSGGTASSGAPASSGAAPSGSSVASGSASAPATAGTKGGTLTFLTNADRILDLDPQRNYTGDDLAFASAYITRSLTTYQMSTDASKANSIIPDAATDTGKASADLKTWTFTLKDGIKWQDGSPVTCADFKYGISRTYDNNAKTPVITGGPTYASQYLDVPVDKAGASIYKGPYDTSSANTAGQAAYDKAVVCSADNKTITFHLNQAVGDFNYAVTLGMAAVPKAKDTKIKYTDMPVSDGPYMIQSYVKGNNLTLVRNPNWDPASDTFRPAYPDKIVLKFGVEQAVLDQTMIKDAPQDQQSVSRDIPLVANLPTIFNNPKTAARAFNGLDVYSYYIAVNVTKVPDLKQRMALAVALDRGALLKIAGGKYAGGPGDGAVKPNIGIDYAPTGMWDGLLGKTIPLSGDSAYAKQLISESGKPMPTIVYSYPKSDDADKGAAAVKLSLGKAGIKVTLNPIPRGQYYGVVFNKDRATALMSSGWGPDWPNASTVIPPLFTPTGGFDLSYVDDKAFNQQVAAAKAETDRTKQSQLWQALDKEASKNVWLIPTRFGLQQGIAGSKVHSASGDNGAVYQWAPYGSWPYTDLYVTP